MSQTLISILETRGPKCLEISNQTFSDEIIFGEFIDVCNFHKINFINCSFEECEFLGANLYLCVFKNCTFNDTTIRKSDIADCLFTNCQFIESHLTPRTNFFRTVFLKSQFLIVDFSFSLLSECEFKESSLSKIKLQQTSIMDSKTKKTSFSELEFDENNPMTIQFTNSSSFPPEI